MAKQTDINKFLTAYSDATRTYNKRLPNQYDRASIIRDQLIASIKGGKGWGGPIPPK